MGFSLNLHEVSIHQNQEFKFGPISLDISEGESVGLIGPNGAGKTTLIRMILGLLQPDHGEILWDQQSTITDSMKRRLGYLPELDQLPELITVEEILRAHQEIYGVSYEIDKICSRTELSPHLSKQIRHLSKGLRRRVSWIWATAHKPDLLVLDEPFSGLDPWGREDMLGWIQAERARGVTLVVCLHELEVLPKLTDRVITLGPPKAPPPGALQVETTGASKRARLALVSIPLRMLMRSRGFGGLLGWLLFSMLGAHLMSELGFRDFSKILYDSMTFGYHLGGGAMSLFWGVWAGTCSTEQNQGDWLLLTPSPLSHWIMGRYLAVCGVLCCLAFGALGVWQVLCFWNQFGWLSSQVLGLFAVQTLGWLVLAALGVMAGCLANSQALAGALSGSLWLLGLMGPTIYQTLPPGTPGWSKGLWSSLAWIWNLQTFNLGVEELWGNGGFSLPPRVLPLVGWRALYGLSLILSLLTISGHIAERKSLVLRRRSSHQTGTGKSERA